MDKIKQALSVIVVFCLTACMLCNIAEIWTEHDVFSKLKYTFLTLFLYSAIMGLLLQAGEQNPKK